MDRRPVIYGTVRQTDRLAQRQTHKEGKRVEGLMKAYAQRLIRTLRQSKEFQHESVSYGVCVLWKTSQMLMCVCVCVCTIYPCGSACASVRKPKKNAAVITLTAAQ